MIVIVPQISWHDASFCSALLKIHARSRTPFPDRV